jgi:hypothetical protein
MWLMYRPLKRISERVTGLGRIVTLMAARQVTVPSTVSVTGSQVGRSSSAAARVIEGHGANPVPAEQGYRQGDMTAVRPHDARARAGGETWDRERARSGCRSI